MNSIMALAGVCCFWGGAFMELLFNRLLLVALWYLFFAIGAPGVQPGAHFLARRALAEYSEQHV